MANTANFMMRADLVEEYGIDASQIKTLEDVEAVFETVKEKDSAMSPVAFGSSFSPIEQIVLDEKFDNLSDYIGVLEDSNDLTVTNFYESETYTELCTMMRRWYQSDYLYEETLSGGNVNVESAVKAGKAFSLFASGKPGVVRQTEQSTGYEMVSVELRSPVSTTGTVTNFMWSIPSYASDGQAAAAMKVLNLMYSDSDVINLLDWGIEGEHYVKTADNENVITYPEGVDADNSGYSLNMNFLFGNQLLSHIWEGDDPDLWTQIEQFNESATFSKALGFSFDTSAVKTEYAAVQNVIDQYNFSLGSGQVDPETTIPEFNTALKAAGLEKILTEKQNALTEWAELNNIS